MKKSTLFLSLAMMLCLSVSLFAEFPQEQDSDYMIPPPQFQQERECNDDMLPFWEIDCFNEDCRPCEPKMDPHKKQFEKGKFGNKNFFDKKFDKLNLTDKQKEDLKNLKESNKKTFKELTTTFQAKVKSLNDEFLKDKYSKKEVKKLTKDIKDISSKLIDVKIAKKEGMRKILTTEQYNKMFKVKTHYDILAERLGLSSEQKEQFIKILKTKKEKEIALKQQLREKDMLLKQEFDKVNIYKFISIRY